MDIMAMSVAIPYIAVDYHLDLIRGGVVMSVFLRVAFLGIHLRQALGKPSGLDR